MQPSRGPGHFALNMLGKGQQGTAFTFFKPSEVDGDTINGEPYRDGSTDAPVLGGAKTHVECRVVEVVERGDHHIVVGEVIDANLPQAIEGRADKAILEMKDLGDNVFYGG